MANSSQSGNILGYASGTQPGLVSTVAQTFAGKKTLDGGASIKGDTSGSAIASGYVGEKRNFSSVTIAAVTSGFKGGSALDTLPIGTWQIYWMVTASAIASATFAEAILATNANNDSTGGLTIDGSTVAYGTTNTSGLTTGNIMATGMPVVITLSGNQAIYPKAVSTGANRNINVTGYAVRIA